MNGLGIPGPFVFLVGLRPLVLCRVWELQHGTICGALLFAMLPAPITNRKVEVFFFGYFDVRYRSPAAAMDGWVGFLVKHHLATCLWVSGQVRPSVSCCGFWMLLADLRIKDSRGAASVRAIANLHERTQLVI